MKHRSDPLDLPVPRDRLGFMLLLQTLVAKGYRHYCAGVLAPAKLEGLVAKFAARYSLGRDARGRTYDRQQGLAALQFACFPGDAGIAWFLLSTDGAGGLTNPASPDRIAGAVRDAMAAAEHLTLGEYVLLYAHKKEMRTVKDKRTGRDKTLWKDT